MGTRRAYRSAWGAFDAWCTSLGREPKAGVLVVKPWIVEQLQHQRFG